MTLSTSVFKWTNPLLLFNVPILLFVMGIGLFGGQVAKGQMTQQIEQYGITWIFEAQHVYGQFANGDYWVLGPVTITEIAPAFSDGHNGWDVNPNHTINQPYDHRMYNYTPSLQPNLPYVATPGESIVKTVSVDTTLPSTAIPLLKTAAVLTVLDEVPVDSGKTFFRPPYFGSEKPMISVVNIDTSLLPSINPTDGVLPIDTVQARFKKLQLDHKFHWTGRYLHPKDNMPDYGSAISSRNADAVLRFLMKTESKADKLPALITYLQYGIDLFYIGEKGGTWWPYAAGHNEGRKLPIAFTGWLLGDSAMKACVQHAPIDRFSENGGVYFSEEADKVLWGQAIDLPDNLEELYWDNQLNTELGHKIWPDPYGYIDGGTVPGGYYQLCCTSQPWKGSVLPLHMICELKEICNFEPILEYVDRWVAEGTWTQTDPCAPVDMTPGTYGITWGPDGSGGCILDNDPSDGIGRHPNQHGTGADNGYYGSAFVNSMWDAYRQFGESIAYAASPDPIVCLGSRVLLELFGIDTSICEISWNGSSFGKETKYNTIPEASTAIQAVVRYANGLGCAVFHDFQITVEVCTQVGDFDLKQPTIAPNPTNQTIGIANLNDFYNGESQIQLFNTNGGLVYEKSEQIRGPLELNLGKMNLSEGIYFLRISNASNVFNKSIVFSPMF